MPSLQVPPAAAALVRSLRGAGYTLDTAVADIIDNSVTAGAGSVDVRFEWNGGEPVVAIVDDGCGMAEATLIEAMRFGGNGPETARAATDLGRFGLGLKTASLSQCRSLTVASRYHGKVACFRWDIDHLAASPERGWELLTTPSAFGASELRRLDGMSSGTVVIWEKVDQGKVSEAPHHDAFLEDLDSLARHLGMVFHRFLDGDARRIRVHLNGNRVRAWDPFLEWHAATRQRPEQKLRWTGGSATVRGFILPHKDRFANPDEYAAAGGPSGWNAQQGFYIYRARRLLRAGGWLGLGGSKMMTRDESSRLARVRIDIPNTADGDWRIDIRKSMAKPPVALKGRLNEIALDIRRAARDVFVHRGSNVVGNGKVTERAWEANAAGTAPRYAIKRSHPAIEALFRACGDDSAVVRAALAAIERSVPVERIWLDASEGETARTADAQLDSELVESALTICGMLIREGLERDVAIERICTVEPFSATTNLRPVLELRLKRVAK